MDVFEEAVMKLAAIKLELLAEKVGAKLPTMPGLTGLKPPAAVKPAATSAPIKAPSMSSVIPQKSIVGVSEKAVGPAVPTGTGTTRKG